ncbi:MAG TPA: serine protease [Solirubrobacteraceae bacterium]|jgi:secreted trypsin-like serine protease|nr:serine protease [Solirubrobacteraceae bacterium]
MHLRTLAPLLAVAMLAIIAAPASAASRPGRIVGGTTAATDTAPWTAYLVATDRSGPQGQFCGATVASPTAVITAAHCVVNTGIPSFQVVTGSDALSAGGQRLDVTGVSVDPGYRPGRTGHDAAVVQLASPTASPAVTVATPDEAGLAAPGTRLLLTGWGLVANNDRATPDNLQEADITAASNKRCRVDYQAAFSGTKMICTTGGLPDACKGDSGGPLVSLNAPAPTLVGIVSFGGQRCGDRRHPGVYTRVSFESAFLQRALSAPPTTPGSGSSSGSIGTIT